MAALAVRIMRSWSFNGASDISCSLKISLTPSTGQKDVPNLSITAYLATAPRLTHALTLLTCVYLTLSPLKLLYRYAHMLSRRNNPHRPVQELAVRAFTFATLSVLILLSGGLLYLFKSLSSGTSVWWLGPFGLGGPVELARAVMALGGSGWLVARVAKVVDPVAAGIYDGAYMSWLHLLLLMSLLQTYSCLASQFFSPVSLGQQTFRFSFSSNGSSAYSNGYSPPYHPSLSPPSSSHCSMFRSSLSAGVTRWQRECPPYTIACTTADKSLE